MRSATLTRRRPRHYALRMKTLWALNLIVVLFAAGEAAAAPDLTPTVLTPPASTVAGQAASVTWTVANQGDGTATPNWRDFFFLSADDVLDGGDRLLTT